MSKGGGGTAWGGGKAGASIPSGFRPPLAPGQMPPAPPQNSWGPGMNFNIPGGGGMSSSVLQNFPKLQAMFGGAGQPPGQLPPIPTPGGAPGGETGGTHGGPKNIQDIFSLIQQLMSGNTSGLPPQLGGILSKLGGMGGLT